MSYHFRLRNRPGVAQPIFLLACGVFLIAKAAPASDSSSKAPADQQEAVLEEVVVTARRKEESAQKVPIAITVLSGQTIADNNARNLQDIQVLVPSLTVSTGNVGSKDTANVDIRGQGWTSLSGQPAVAMYLNEVPIATNVDGQLMGGPGLFFDLEAVEVLKGPQGTLFGKNTAGGAVLLRSAQPKDEFGGHVGVGVGNYGDREYDLAVNIPLVDGVLLTRLAVNGQVRDGYTKIQSAPGHPNGIDFDNRDTFSIRETILYTPTDNLQNETYLTYQKYSSHGSGAFLVDYTPFSNSPLLPQYLAEQNALGARNHIPISTAPGRNDGFLKSVQNITTVTISPNLKFRNIVGAQSAEINQSVDVDGTPDTLFDVPVLGDPVNQFSEEGQLQGNAFTNRLDWQAGFFALRESSPVNSPLQIDLINVPGVSAYGRRGNVQESKAIYTQGTFSLTDKLKLTLGARQTWDRGWNRSLGADPSDPTPSFCGEPKVNCSYEAPALINKSHALTWTVGLEGQVTQKTLVYLESRRGYRPGGENVVTLPVDPTNLTGIGPTYKLLYPYNSEYVTDYELGVKSDWMIGDVAVRTNADVYDQEYSGIQVNRLIFFPGLPAGANVTANAANARLWGAELEATAEITKNLSVGIFGDHLNFKYVNFLSGVDGNSIIAGETANRVPNRIGANLGYRASLQNGAGTLRFGGTWSWQDKSGDFLGNHVIPAYDVANLSLNWEKVYSKPLDLSLFVSNVFDKTYKTGGIGFGLGFVEATYGDPRMYGVRLKYDFGAKD